MKDMTMKAKTMTHVKLVNVTKKDLWTMIVTMSMANVLAKLTQLWDVSVIKLPQDIMTSPTLNLVNVMKKDL